MKTNDSQNMITNTPSEEQTIQPTPQPSTPPIQNDNSTNSGKKSLVILVSFFVIALAAAIIFAILFFTKAPSEQPSTETPTSEEEPPVSTDTEEVEITDTYVIRDLDEKIAILHDTSQIEATINKGTVVGGYSNNILNMYSSGYLEPSPFRIAYVIRSLESQFHYLNTDEREVVINSVQPEYREEVQKLALQGIDADTVAKKYKDVFGEELSHETSDNCYTYEYNSTYNFYYQNPIGGCGGTSPYKTFHYKNKYTADEENAYVYVSVALSDAETNNVYCDISYLDISGVWKLSDEAKVCANLSENTEFTLDESNYQDFAQYRFVFSQADNGTYYFVKVEKL